MKIKFFLFCILISNLISAQIYDKKERCSKEIVLLQEHDSISNSSKEYKALKCLKRSNFGMRFGLGFSSFKYDDNTKDIIGNHGGANFNLSFSYDKWNLGVRFKPWTVNPKQEITVNNKTLPKFADVNVIKLDYYIGYSFDFKKLYSVEPYIGYNNSLFVVINEDELRDTFSFDNKASGLIFGTTFNKYFEFQDFNYISVFVDLGYSTTNLSDIHPTLGKGYFEFSIGVAIKGFSKKTTYKKYKSKNQKVFKTTI